MWKYKIIDNFFEQRHFDMLCSKINNIKDINETSWKRYVHQVSADGKVMYSHGPINKDGTQLADGILTNEEIVDLFNTYNKKLLDILAELAPQKLASYKSSGISLILSGKDKKYMAHCDVDSKILSTVVYLSPEKNKGTLLAENQEMDNAQEVEWKPNRALIFSSEKNVTWHSYESDGVNTRLVLVWYLQQVEKSSKPKPGKDGSYFKPKKKKKKKN